MERSELQNILKNDKILLVYDATTSDLKRQLGMGLTTMTSGQNTYYAVASAGWTNNVIASGGVLYSEGRNADSSLLKTIRDYVPYFRSAIQQVEAMASSENDFIIITPGISP